MFLLLKKALLAMLLGRTFGSVLVMLLALLAPVAGILKLIGIPILIVLAIVALPAMLVLAVIGLPIMFVVVAGVAIMGVVGMVLALSVAVLKVAIPLVLVFFVLRFVWRLVFGPPKSDTPPPVSEGPAPETL